MFVRLGRRVFSNVKVIPCTKVLHREKFTSPVLVRLAPILSSGGSLKCQWFFMSCSCFSAYLFSSFTEPTWSKVGIMTVWVSWTQLMLISPRKSSSSAWYFPLNYYRFYRCNAHDSAFALFFCLTTYFKKQEKLHTSIRTVSNFRIYP